MVKKQTDNVSKLGIEHLQVMSHLVADLATDGFFGIDAQGRISFANSMLSSITGWDAAELVGQQSAVVLGDQHLNGTGPGSGKPKGLSRLKGQDRLATGTVQRVKSATLQTKEGAIIQGELASVCLFQGSKPAGWVVCFMRADSPSGDGEPKLAQSSEFQSLLHIASLLVQPGAFEDKANQVLEELVRIVQADRVLLMVPEEHGLRSVSAAGPGVDDLPMQEHVPEGQGLVDLAMRRGQPVLGNDYATHPQAVQGLVDSGVKSLVVLPIKVDGRILGMLSVASREQDHFTADRMRLLTAVVDAMGALLENARLMMAEHNRTQEAEAMFQIARVLAQPGTFEEKAVRVLQELARATEADIVSLGVPEEELQAIRCVATAGKRALNPAESPLASFATSMPGLAYSNRTPVVVNDSATFPFELPDLGILGGGSAASIPIRSGGDILGVITVSSEQVNHFASERLRFLRAVGEGVGTLLENQKLYREIGEQMEEGNRRLDLFQTAATRLTLLEESPDQALEQLVALASQLVSARYGAVVVWGPDGTVTKLISSGDLSQAGDAAEGGLNLGDVLSLVHLVLVKERKKSIRVGNLTDSPTPSASSGDQPPLQSLLGLPFTVVGESSGAFFLVDKDGSPRFSADDERLLRLFSVLAGVLLDNLDLYNTVDRERNTLTAIQSSMTEGLVVLDPEGRFLYCNHAAERLWSIDAKAIQGKQMEQVLRRMRPDFETAQTADALRAIVLEAPLEPTTVAVTMVTPHRRELAATVFPIQASSTERMTGILVRDVTEERDLQRRRETFVSVASHELRTPMTTIMGFTELLLWRDSSKKQRKDWLEHIYEDSKRIVSIVDDLLSVSRIQSGRVSLNLRHLSMQEVVGEVIDRLRSTTDHHELLTDLPDDLPKVMADGDKLAQVLLNLVSNAIKYSPEGKQVTVAARHLPDKCQVVVDVIDQGIGISPRDQERLFSTFYRVHRLETERVRGTGLGLYIVKGLVESMGGQVWLKSVLNKGSTFSFTLPTEEEPK